MKGSKETYVTPFNIRTETKYNKRGAAYSVTNYRANGANMYRSFTLPNGKYRQQIYINGGWQPYSGAIPEGLEQPLHMTFTDFHMTPAMFKNLANQMAQTAASVCTNNDPANCIISAFPGDESWLDQEDSSDPADDSYGASTGGGGGGANAAAKAAERAAEKAARQAEREAERLLE